ncbi:hypothetical protein D3C85_1194640 [compost metagenome]
MIVLTLLGLVDHLQAVDVFDLPPAVFAKQAPVLADVERDHRPFHQCHHQGGDHHQQYGGVADQARAQQVRLATLQLMFGGIADQSPGVAHFVHDRIAGVDARGATDAFHLQAIADVDAGRADLYAELAIDAIAQTDLGGFDLAFARATVFATGHVVGNGQGVFVEHHALEPRIRAHVHAHRFTQPAGIDVGGTGEK